MYPAGDGRLKTLNFVINDAAYLNAILTCGERVDGSSLFSFIEAGSSDLYAIPRFRTAFIDPFAEIPTLTMLCSFFNKDGEPLESSPEYTLHKACRAFTEVTGMQFEAMGELEYYIIAPDNGLFPATDQHGYHGEYQNNLQGRSGGESLQHIMGPKVLLINEYSASDGDLFPYRFKYNKLGTVIGKRTWGGVVGYSGTVPVVDGGSIVTPSYAPYATDGSGFIIEGKGVEPNIELENDPYKEYMGENQQLNKAIEVALDKLKTERQDIPAIPAFPDKSKKNK